MMSDQVSEQGVPVTALVIPGTPIIPATPDPPDPPQSDTKEDINFAAIIKQYKRQPIDATGCEEVCVAVVGSVDAGKSSTIGVLAYPGLSDDGRGRARDPVFRHPHEHESGRTSDISYQYLKDEDSKRVFTFIDLAGHAKYLRTTVNGLTMGHPDMAIVCISDKITDMTLEHMNLVMSLHLPLVIIFTKIDMNPADLTAKLIVNINKRLGSIQRKLFHIRSEKDFDMVKNTKSLVPFITTSNKTLENIPLVRHALRAFPKRERNLIDGFSVESIYYVHGYGTVVSGMVGHDINKGDLLYMGPLEKGNFIQVKVKTMHNDYRHFVTSLPKGVRGCLCIKVAERDRPFIRKGIVLTNTIPKNICRTFVSKLRISHHHTTIKVGFQLFANCGMIREPVQFLAIQDENKNTIGSIKSGDVAYVTIGFLKNLNYIEVGQTIIFREGDMRGMGTITELIEAE